jgi:hypothetical protein
MNMYSSIFRGNVERVLFSEKGIQALQTLRSTYTRPTGKTIQALATLQALSNEPSGP